MAVSEDERRAERCLRDVQEEQNRPEVETDFEREREFGAGLFSRMRTDWRGEDREAVDLVRHKAQMEIYREFRDVYGIIIDIYMTVRIPKVTPDGEPVFDEFGVEPEWERDGFGKIIEDWNKLGFKDREKAILEISTVMLDVEQRAANMWGLSQIAKAQWEDDFVDGFLNSKGTNDVRTSTGKRQAREARYFAIYQSWVSRKADALARSLERLCQRLKDLG